LAGATAVVVVAMQRAFVDVLRAAGRARGVVAASAALLADARAGGAHVVHVRAVAGAGGALFGGTVPFPADCAPGAEIIGELAPLAGERVLAMTGLDPFATAGLADTLASLGCATVVVAGVSAYESAGATCLGSSDRHYLTVVPLDCQADLSDEAEAMAYAQYQVPAYAYNIVCTRTGLLRFTPGAVP
jgi:nicotinamidase-related amidase